ncbi:MAG: DNA cytosine methyltransferase [Candidatus Diapherotrites archaeon]
MEAKSVAVVDVFCGVGGLTHGFVKENFNVVAGIDSDASCKFAYEANNNSKFINKPIQETSSEELKTLYPKNAIKVLVGCAPCQPFSTYNIKKRRDDKWGLLYEFSRLIEEVKPEIVSMENVPQLMRAKVFHDFVQNLEALDYHVTYSTVNAMHYGVPQTRKRLVLLASKLGELELIAPTHKNPKTVRQAICKLEKISDGETSPKDKLHRSRKLSQLNKKRIVATPMGGGWRDWDKTLVLSCHKKKGGKSFGSVYGRMNWDGASPTITTQCIGLGNGRFGHPEQDRAISLREAAILQSFPKSYKFIDPKDKYMITRLARHIGNAVPVKLGRAIAKTVRAHIGGVNYGG